MQVKLLHAPHGQKDMLVQTQHGTRIFDIGVAQDLPVEEAAAILGGPYGYCFEKSAPAASKPTPEAKAVVRAAQATVKPKADPEDEAAEEATKMVSSKDYKTK